MTRDPFMVLTLHPKAALPIACLPTTHPLKFTLTAINLPSLLPRGPDVRTLDELGWKSLPGSKIQVVKHAPKSNILFF